MAFNTTADKALAVSVNLGDLVSSKLNATISVRKRERAVTEAKFQQTVIDQGLSYEAQIEYRKKQLEEEGSKISPDVEYITDIQGSLSSIRQLLRFKKIREDYLTNYEALKQGKISLRSHEKFLEKQLKGVTDEDARKEIRDELANVRAQVGTEEINTLQNRVLLAQKDGSVRTIEKTIDEIAKRKAFADLAGNTEESSAWDVSIMSLRKQLNEIKVENSLHDIDLKVTRSGGGAIEKLDMLNAEIAKADGSSPITVKGTTFNSAKDFWTGKRDEYVAGVGTDKAFGSFFSDLEGEVKDKIDTVSRINTFGFVPTATLDAIQQNYSALTARAEFATQAAKLDASRTAALAYGLERSGAALVQSSVETLSLNSGLSALESLEKKYGIDLSSTKADLNAKIISKGSELPGIKKATENLGAVGAERPAGDVPDAYLPGNVFKSNVQPPSYAPNVAPSAPVGTGVGSGTPGQPLAQPKLPVSGVQPLTAPVAPIGMTRFRYIDNLGQTQEVDALTEADAYKKAVNRDPASGLQRL